MGGPQSHPWAWGRPPRSEYEDRYERRSGSARRRKGSASSTPSPSPRGTGRDKDRGRGRQGPDMDRSEEDDSRSWQGDEGRRYPHDKDDRHRSRSTRHRTNNHHHHYSKETTRGGGAPLRSVDPQASLSSPRARGPSSRGQYDGPARSKSRVVLDEREDARMAYGGSGAQSQAGAGAGIGGQQRLDARGRSEYIGL